MSCFNFCRQKLVAKWGHVINPTWQAFQREGNFGAKFGAGAKGGGGGAGEKHEGENPTPLLFSFPLNPLPLSTAATQATCTAIKTTQLPTDYTGGYMIFEGKNYFHFWLSC